ncbi:putative quinol monooxygenase [Fluviispira multicolorata]|uniref:ABM domain-containing protein n=1 Tax=Fluviispira multicolorata TaxID=2654512 RepID=A0A833JGZ0_9BACT|nr:antibiotic biosynthesis monooxygenase [Fluviispira multicolorata]KAB8033122.1 hypothetical protein GCL57_00050 [Fluviispira multicolorata]
MIKYLFEFFVKEEYKEEFKTEIDLLKKSAMSELGCVLFDYITVKNCFIIIEYWEDINSFNNHSRQENTLNFRKKVSNIILRKRIKYNLFQAD